MNQDTSLNPGANLAAALILLALGSAALLQWPAVDNSAFHAILDTGVLLANVMLALVLLEISARAPEVFPRLLTICFIVAGLGELEHTFTALESLAGLRPGGPAGNQWRAATWGIQAHVLPLSLGAALLLRDSSRKVVLPFGLITTLLLAAALLVDLDFPRYSPPNLFGITRPSLILVPILWIVVGFVYRPDRRHDDVAHAVSLMAVVMLLAHITMLYSHSPNDSVAMVASGKARWQSILADVRHTDRFCGRNRADRD